MDRSRHAIGARVRRAVVLCVAALAAAVIMTWPLATGLDRLGRTANSGDARVSVWNVAWVAHALLTDPADLFDANIFHPHRNALAFSEANLVSGVIALPVWWLTRNPDTAHNVVVLFSFNAGRHASEMTGFSLQWYGTALRNPFLVEALENSLIVASTSAVLRARYPVGDRCTPSPPHQLGC